MAVIRETGSRFPFLPFQAHDRIILPVSLCLGEAEGILAKESWAEVIMSITN